MKFLIFQKIYDNFYFKGYVDILVQVLFKSKSNYMTTESESTLRFVLHLSSQKSCFVCGHIMHEEIKQF